MLAQCPDGVGGGIEAVLENARKRSHGTRTGPDIHRVGIGSRGGPRKHHTHAGEIGCAESIDRAMQQRTGR